MVEPQIRYDDGAMRWIDVGCGSGAFTELLVETWAPAVVQGIDPPEAQLAHLTTSLRSPGSD